MTIFRMSGVNIFPFQDKEPEIAPTVFLASGVCLSGDVRIDEYSNIWFNVSIRGDVNEIRIGQKTNIQDNSVIHVTHGGHGTYIGDRVTIGHSAIVHACTLNDECLIGMGAIILDGAIIPKHCLVAAGSVVTGGKTFPEKSLIVGSPAKVKRTLTEKEIADIRISSDHYVKLSEQYAEAPKSSHK